MKVDVEFKRLHPHAVAMGTTLQAYVPKLLAHIKPAHPKFALDLQSFQDGESLIHT